ncbi:hypothetical protein V1477_007748 [Vespula maculifrons]|uniref:Uncharacterized protein n=1 Tax=Vespula maculifrons TaxID=7453 RepID=A0ABD2CFM0_VESMC
MYIIVVITDRMTSGYQERLISWSYRLTKTCRARITAPKMGLLIATATSYESLDGLIGARSSLEHSSDIGIRRGT